MPSRIWGSSRQGLRQSHGDGFLFSTTIIQGIIVINFNIKGSFEITERMNNSQTFAEILSTTAGKVCGPGLPND